MRNLIFKNLINSYKHLLRVDSFVLNHLDQIRAQSTIAFKTFATSSKLPPLELTNVETKAIDLLSKKHANPYLLFVEKQYKVVAEKNPSNTWKSMTFDEKITYLDDASKQRQEKKVELASLFKTKEEADAFNERQKEMRSLRRRELKQFREKKEKNLLKRPKKPPGAFFLFAKTLDRGEAPVTQFTKGASQKWRSLPVQDKEKFEDDAKKLYEKYKEDLKAWEVKMMADGKTNLVRKSFVESVKKTLNQKEKVAQKMRKAKKAKSNRKQNTKKSTKKEVLSDIDNKIKQIE